MEGEPNVTKSRFRIHNPPLFFKTLFGKEIDKLEHANDDERTYYIIETDPVVNRYISVPKDKGSL